MRTLILTAQDLYVMARYPRLWRRAMRQEVAR